MQKTLGSIFIGIRRHGFKKKESPIINGMYGYRNLDLLNVSLSWAVHSTNHP